MAIRMEKDEPQRQQPGGGGQKRPSGGGNALLRLLPLILLFVFKRPKLLIPILLVGAVWYFFLGGQEMLSGTLEGEEQASSQQFSLGANLDEEVYSQALAYEPLAYGTVGQAALPARASLERFAPQRRHQGSQGSCVGWASAYGARTILEAQASGKDPNSVAFSPAYLYNQIALSGCQGAYMLDAMKSMQQYGSLPYSQFRYDERTCSNPPSNAQRQAGQQYRIQGFDRLTQSARDVKPDLLGVKQHVAQGYPVVIGMMVGGSFMGEMAGKSLWQPSQRDFSMRGYSGHAMCVIGYDDQKHGGAFQIMNSWGEDWGERGNCWVRYRDFDYFVKEAYGVYPTATAQERNQMAVEFGLLDVNTQNIIGLAKKDETVFQTIKPLKKGDRFKVLIANSIECYVYVFGQEADGSSYVLFPYTEQHSPYCGITGTRLFPRDYSMVPDQVGNKDFIAVVISKEEIDFKQFNNRLNANRTGDYAARLRQALGNDRITNVSYKPSNTVSFQAETEGKKAVGMVIEIDKQ